jgi:hypothetical protein
LPRGNQPGNRQQLADFFNNISGEQTFAAYAAYLAMTTKADIQAISNTVFTHAAASPY